MTIACARHGRGRRAVTSDIVGLGRGFLQKLRAHVFIRVVKFDLLGDGHAVVSDRRRAELLVQRNVAPLRSQRRRYGIGEFIDTALESPARFITER